MKGKPISRETAEELFDAYCKEPIPFAQICEKRGISPVVAYALFDRMGFDFRSVDRKIQCAVCGQLFRPRNGNHIFCSVECKKTRHIQQMRNWHTNKKNSPAPVEKNDVQAFAAKAKSQGMSYGKYVAMMQQEGS